MKNKWLVALLVLFSMFLSAMTWATTAKGTRGDVRQQICVITDKTATEGMIINTASSMEDTRIFSTHPGKKERGSASGVITVETNSPAGSYCSPATTIGEINADGYVYASIWISSLEGNEIDKINVRSYFNGQGANNDWDLEDNGQCASSGGYGVYMSYKGLKTCGKIIDVPDEDGVIINFSIDVDKIIDKNFTYLLMADPQAWRTSSSNDPNNDNTYWHTMVNNGISAASKYKSENNEKYDFSIINGDMTEFGREETWDDTLAKLAYSASVNTDKIYFGLGNHDYENNVGDCYEPGWGAIDNKNGCAAESVSRMASEFPLYLTQLKNFRVDWHSNNTDEGQGSLSYSWDYKGVHFVQLQNNPTYHARIDGLRFDFDITASLNWLEQDLATVSSRGIKDIIINMHDATQSFVNQSSSEDKKRFHDIMMKYKPIAIFAGHAHRFEYLQGGGDDPLYGSTPVFVTDALFNSAFHVVNYNNGLLTVTEVAGIDGVPHKGSVHTVKSQVSTSENSAR